MLSNCAQKLTLFYNKHLSQKTIDTWYTSNISSTNLTRTIHSKEKATHLLCRICLESNLYSNDFMLLFTVFNLFLLLCGKIVTVSGGNWVQQVSWDSFRKRLIFTFDYLNVFICAQWKQTSCKPAFEFSFCSSYVQHVNRNDSFENMQSTINCAFDDSFFISTVHKSFVPWSKTQESKSDASSSSEIICINSCNGCCKSVAGQGRLLHHCGLQREPGCCATLSTILLQFFIQKRKLQMYDSFCARKLIYITIELRCKFFYVIQNLSMCTSKAIHIIQKYLLESSRFYSLANRQRFSFKTGVIMMTNGQLQLLLPNAKLKLNLPSFVCVDTKQYRLL